MRRGLGHAAAVLLSCLLAGCGEDPATPPLNGPPTACFTVTPELGDSEDLFVFDADCSSDPEDAPSALRFDWDWDGDGAVDTSALGDPAASRRFQAGEHVVVLTVIDSGGAQAADTALLAVFPHNDAPQACFAVSPATGDTETDFAFDASCSDDAQDGVAGLRFDWDWDGDGAIDFSAQGEPAAAWRFAAGEHAVILSVVDAGGLAASDTLMLSVAAHVPPPGVFATAPAGSFTMGSLDDAPDADSFEFPRHEVTLSQAFRVQSTEVTNAQYLEMMQWALDRGHATLTSNSLRDALDGSTVELLDMDQSYCEIEDNGLELVTDKPDHPVRAVTWYGAAAYCDWLSLREFLPRAYDHADWSCGGGDPYSAEGYRLPTEAEWEYACRAGTQTSYAGGMVTEPYCSPPDPVLAAMGWYCANAGGAPHEVAQLAPNDWGLFDMHGNLAEWCGDWFDRDTYTSDPVTDPLGPATGTNRVRRGGVFFDSARHCRSATRRDANPVAGGFGFGFRPVRGEP